MEYPIPTLEESKVPSSTYRAAAGAVGAIIPVMVQFTDPSKDAAAVTKDMSRASADTDNNVLSPKGR